MSSDPQPPPVILMDSLSPAEWRALLSGATVAELVETRRVQAAAGVGEVPCELCGRSIGGGEPRVPWNSADLADRRRVHYRCAQDFDRAD